ncbi:MAG TPA: hypothetical protein VGD81_19960 [Opitutaceae bacterium]
MHRFIPDPQDSSVAPRLDPGHTAAIKRWTAECLRLDEAAVVSVVETACIDPGCPLVETVITVFDAAGTRTWKLTRPRAAVTKLMIQQTLTAPGGG